MIPMPEQKTQLEKIVFCKRKVLFDHEGVQIPELNFKEKKKKGFYFRPSNSQIKS